MVGKLVEIDRLVEGGVVDHRGGRGCAGQRGDQGAKAGAPNMRRETDGDYGKTLPGILPWRIYFLLVNRHFAIILLNKGVSHE